MSYAIRRLSASVLVVALLCTGLSLSGCATVPGQPPPPPILDRVRPLLRIAVSMATDRLLTQHPQLVPITLQTATALGDVVNAGDFTSIAEVAAFLRARIPWETLSAEARMVFEALLSGIGEELRVLALQYEIPQTQAILLVKDILGWIAEVARRHTTVPVRVPTIR